MLSLEQMKALPESEQKKLFSALKLKRATYKKVNYTAVYGAGDAAVARAAGVPQHEGKKLKEAYWKRNWSVLAIAAEQTVKKCLGGMWLFNPVSELWYSLRYEKDRFSTLNQGTGVWAFDTWVRHVRSGGLKLCGQMHDEIIAPIKLGQRERLQRHVDRAMEKTNEELKLNRELGCSLSFGNSYSEVH